MEISEKEVINIVKAAIDEQFERSFDAALANGSGAMIRKIVGDTVSPIKDHLAGWVDTLTGEEHPGLHKIVLNNTRKLNELSERIEDIEEARDYRNKLQLAIIGASVTVGSPVVLKLIEYFFGS